MGMMGDPQQQADHAGLQAYNPESAAPEVVPNKRSSYEAPEAVTSEHAPNKTVDAYYADAPEQYDGYYSVPPKYEYHEDQQAQEKRKKRRKVFVWVGVAVLVVIIIVAAVVGGVVGSAAARNSSASSAAASPAGSSSNSTSSNATSVTTSTPPDTLKVVSSAGMAITTLNGGQQRYAYAQQKSGAVIEIPYVNNDWAFDKYQTVTTNANAGSSIAAAAYNLNGTSYRTVVFMTADRQLMVTTAGTDNAWSKALSILTYDNVILDSPSLAICVDTDVLNGIRVYFGSYKTKWIREVGYDLSNSKAKWTMYTNFTDAAVNSGVACSMSNGYNHLYYRNGTQIQQRVWNYAQVDNIWHNGAMSSGSYVPSETSNLAATTNGSGDDYVFYRLANASIVRGVSSGSNNVFDQYNVYLATGQLTDFSAAYVGSGAVGQTILEYAPINGGGLTYAITESSGNTSSTGLLAYWG